MTKFNPYDQKTLTETQFSGLGENPQPVTSTCDGADKNEWPESA